MNSNLWLGSQSTYEVMLEAQANALAKYGDNQDAPEPVLLSVQGNVGIIDIRGSLINGRAGFMSYFGITGYGDIRESLVAAIQNPDVHAILLNIDSGGGAVAGVHETAQLIARVDKIKPVVSYTGGTEASAALWLGSSARHSYTAETAVSGSLGIIMIHAEKSAQLQKDGIKVTVIRAGSEKALGNSYEPLSAAAKASLEAQAETMYGIFLGHVAPQRGMTTTVADTKFGQGRTFIGKQAVDVGLMDAMGTLEDAFVKASALGSKIAAKTTPTGQAKPQQTMLRAETPATFTANISEVLGEPLSLKLMASDNAPIVEGTPMPKPLTTEQLVAMAAGVVLDTAPTLAEVEAAADAAAAAAAAKVIADAAAAAAAAPAANTEALTTDTSGVVDLLKAQLKDVQAELLTSKMEAKAAADGLTLANSSMTALAEIARNSVRTMTVALGGKAESVDVMSAADVVSEHSRVAAVFKSKFKVGGVAATTIEEEKPVKAAVNPLFLYATQSLSK